MSDVSVQPVQGPDGLPDRYEILGLLGTGGMGRVLHARDRILDREVAVKVLTPYCALDESYAKRFLNEARAAARLNHPNIVQIYEFGNQDGCAFLVMEYVDGPSLKGALAQDGPFTELRAAELIGEACKALGAAHQQGIMHRDVKPDNMMLTAAGHFKLVDLGLAKAEEGCADQTVTGATMGTPHYISPEQILGAKVIDRRSDIYSLGASLFCLATGSAPFEGSSGAHIMARHLNDPLPDPRDLVPRLSEGFCRAVSRAMAKDPDQRYQDTRDLKADLDAVRAAAEGAAIQAWPIPGDGPDMTVPMATVQTPSGAAFCPTFEPPCSHDDLQRLEDELTRSIGPMARVLVGRESAKARSREALLDALAAHVPDRSERRRFLKRFGAADTGSGDLSRTGSYSGSHSGSHSGSSSVLMNSVDPAVLGALTRHLADHIGPLAGVLVKREAAAGGGFDAIVERLGQHVADAKERREFLGAVGGLG